MICEAFLCQAPATHRAIVKADVITWPHMLCTGHATGALPVEGTILIAQEMH